MTLAVETYALYSEMNSQEFLPLFFLGLTVDVYAETLLRTPNPRKSAEYSA